MRSADRSAAAAAMTTQKTTHVVSFCPLLRLCFQQNHVSFCFVFCVCWRKQRWFLLDRVRKGPPSDTLFLLCDVSRTRFSTKAKCLSRSSRRLKMFPKDLFCLDVLIGVDAYPPFPLFSALTRRHYFGISLSLHSKTIFHSFHFLSLPALSLNVVIRVRRLFLCPFFFFSDTCDALGDNFPWPCCARALFFPLKIPPKVVPSCPRVWFCLWSLSFVWIPVV